MHNSPCLRSWWARFAWLLLAFVPPPCHADDKAELEKAWREGAALQKQQSYPEAIRRYQHALQLAEKVHGPESATTATLLNEAGDAYWETAEYDKAEPLYRRSLQIKESVLGPDHLDVATSLNNLAFLYWTMGRYDQAEPLYQRSLTIRQSRLAPDHLDVATSLNNLAVLYKDMGRYDRAEPLYQRCLNIWSSRRGPDHPDVAWGLNNLAALYEAMGQYDKAEPLCRRSLQIRESQLGPDDLAVAWSLNNLAHLYSTMGQHGKAEPLYRRSLKIKESVVGPDHPDVATSLNNLALLYSTWGRYDKAEPLYRRCLGICESKLGHDHLDVAGSLNNLAALYEAIGLYDKAEPLYRRSLAILESRLGPDHPDLATGLNNLAGLYENMRRYDQAEPLYRRSLAIREARLGPDHPQVATSLNNLAGLCWARSQYDEAERLYRRSLALWESKLGPDHPGVALSLNNLAVVHKAMGRNDQAEPLHQRSLAIRESALGPDHPDLAISLLNLACLHAATERWAEAVAQTDRQRRIVRRHVARTLPLLNEREQLTFLQTQDQSMLHIALSLGLRRRADAATAERSAGWVINGKGVTHEVLAQREILAVEGNDPTLASLVQQLLSIRRRLAALCMAPPKPGGQADHRRELQALSRQEQELSTQLGRATGRNTLGEPWIEIDAVRRSLAPDAVLVEIVRHQVYNFQAKGTENGWSAPHYTAWLIPAQGRGDVTIADLGEARTIDDAVRAARQALEKSETAIGHDGEVEAEKKLRAAMAAVAQLVFEPLEKHLGQAQQLIVSPDAALWLVPWGALPLPEGKYAIEKYPIRYVVSGRDLVRHNTAPRPTLTDPVLFANPDYDLEPGAVDSATRAVLRSAAATGQLASSRGLVNVMALRLPGTAREAAAIRPNVARYAGVEPTVYEDQYALEGVFKAMHRPRVLVLSTHGFFMPDQEVERREDRMEADGQRSRSRTVLTTDRRPLENPLLRCGLLLAGCNQEADLKTAAGVDDGILTGLEIVGTDLRGTELVVLSACETGLGQIRNGEGVAGLRQAFQLAGAKAVVATLWPIPDEETVSLINAFFAHLSAGQSGADALRNAQLSQIKGGRAARGAAHPYYWAAFTLTGP